LCSGPSLGLRDLQELTAPLDVAAPLAVRVLGGAPESLSPCWWPGRWPRSSERLRSAHRPDRRGRRRSRARDRGPAVRAVVVAGTVLASVAGPAGRPIAVGLAAGLHLGRSVLSGRDDPISWSLPWSRRRLRRIAAHRRRLRVASSHLDRRRGCPGGDVRGVRGPPTGSLAARPIVCDAVARSASGPFPTAR
jgi:hypothetical protein